MQPSEDAMSPSEGTDNSSLTIRIIPDEGRQPSLSSVGSDLILIQRLINTIVEYDLDDALNAYEIKERREMTQLTITEVRNASVGIIAGLFNMMKSNPALWFGGSAVSSAFLQRLGTFLFDKVIQLNQQKNPFKPNEKTRKRIEAIAKNARSGGHVILFQMGPLVCIIDRATEKQLEALRQKKFRGMLTPYSGLVVGNDMYQRRLEIEIDQLRNLSKDIPCTFGKKELLKYRPFSSYNTRVNFSGIPVWEGVEEAVGPPHFIQLRTMVFEHQPNPQSQL